MQRTEMGKIIKGYEESFWSDRYTLLIVVRLSCMKTYTKISNLSTSWVCSLLHVNSTSIKNIYVPLLKDNENRIRWSIRSILNISFLLLLCYQALSDSEPEGRRLWKKDSWWEVRLQGTIYNHMSRLPARRFSSTGQASISGLDSFQQTHPILHNPTPVPAHRHSTAPAASDCTPASVLPAGPCLSLTPCDHQVAPSSAHWTGCSLGQCWPGPPGHFSFPDIFNRRNKSYRIGMPLKPTSNISSKF